MAKRLAALAALLLMAAPSAHAAENGRRWFGDFLQTLPTAGALTGAESFPVLMGNGDVRMFPGAGIVTPTGTQELTNKTIDCGSNTCLNFPGGGGGGTGDVVGPGNAVSGQIPTFGDSTGKLLSSSGIAASALVTLSDAQTLTNKSLTTPTIILPTDCTGLPDGTLYNRNGSPAICIIAAVLTADDGSTPLTADDGTTPLNAL